MLYPKCFGMDPMFPKATDFLVVNKDEKSGKGVITYRAFKKGDVLAHFTGEVVPEIRQHTLQITPNRHLYDPHFSGYFLHSCSPNISVDMDNRVVTAIKDIPANSYLYMDYAQTEDYLYKQFPCACGSRNCRGWITGKKEILPVVSSTYLSMVNN